MSEALHDGPLVATKTRPPAHPGSGVRGRIVGRLNAITNERTRLTLLSAPPGYGKTIAIAGWLAAQPLGHAWLSLDAGDNDLARFVRYLAAALAEERPGLEAFVPGLFGPGDAPSPLAVGATILGALAASDDELVLVLDDYQAIISDDIHALVRFLVERVPPFVHLVVLTREDPPFPLARLRAHGQLLELRADDLRYTMDEAAAYLADAGIGLEAPVVGHLVERTEGWVAGLQLAAISLRGRPDAAAAVAAFGGSQRFVLDYLADEVLAGLDDGLRRFLVRTSIADRFTAELCDVLTGDGDAASQLAAAEQANLFLVPLDDERRWFRYHHLFADYLRSQLEAAERHDLHLLAAAFFERSGSGPEAIEHALAAGSDELAVRLLEGEGRRAFDAGEVSTLGRWIEALPAEAIESSMELGSLRAWLLFYTGRMADAAACAGRLLEAEPATTPSAGRLLILRALIATSISPDAERLAREGLELVGDDLLFRALGLEAAGLGRLARGDFEDSVATLREAFAAATRAGYPMAVLPVVNPLGHALMATGRRDEAERICREVLVQHAGPGGTPLPVAWSTRLLLGIALYEGDAVPEARRELEAGFEDARALGIGRPVMGWAVPYLALARQATGAVDAAFEALQVSPHDARVTGMTLPSVAGETEARLRLLQSDLTGARRWAEAPIPDAPAGSPLLAILGNAITLTVARIRLAEGRTAEAAGLLASVRAAFQVTGGVADLISVGLLEAAVAEANGDRRAAVRALGEAVRLAAPGGYRRRFIDDGAGIRHLLPEVRGVAPGFVDELISAGASDTGAVLAADRAPAAGASDTDLRGRLRETADGFLVEALTDREFDVLRLMATGASNKEIATGLGMSVGTAKWHVGHVIAKLGATSRTQALVRAQQLSLV